MGVMQRGLASLERQPFTDFEVIFVDDCSTDATYAFLQDFCRRTNLDARLACTEKNSGPGKAREVGISISTGKYIAFMDSDDWYDDRFLQEIYRSLQTDNYDVLFFDFYRNYKSGKKRHIKCTAHLGGISSMNEYVAMAFDSLCALIVKSDVVKKIKMPFLYNSEDAAVVPLLVALSRKVTYVPTPFYNYLYREQSLSTSQDKRVYRGFIDAFEFIHENIPVEFQQEKEYRGIHLVLYGAVFKAIDAGVAKREIKDIVCAFEKTVPLWHTNKYMKFLPLRKRLFLQMVKRRCFFFLSLYVAMQRFLLRLK